MRGVPAHRLAALGAGLLLACTIGSPPAPVTPTVVPQADAARMMRVAGALAHDSMQGRRTGSEGAAAARRLLLRELEARGIPPLVPGYAQPFPATLRTDTVTGVNLLGVIRGTQFPETYIVATAHYDHVGVRNGEVFNGADDNASGVVGLLELGSWFREHPPRHSIVIALLDAEEVGLQGARAFLDAGVVPVESIALNVNLDMIGRNTRNELYAVGTRRHPELRPFVEQAAAERAITASFGHEGGGNGDDWTTMSDHAPFHQRGIRFLYFGVEDHPDYHRPTDDPERLQPAFLAEVVSLIIDVVTRIDTTLESPR